MAAAADRSSSSSASTPSRSWTASSRRSTTCWPTCPRRPRPHVPKSGQGPVLAVSPADDVDGPLPPRRAPRPPPATEVTRERRPDHLVAGLAAQAAPGPTTTTPAAGCVVHPAGVQGICTQPGVLHIPVEYHPVLPPDRAGRRRARHPGPVVGPAQAVPARALGEHDRPDRARLPWPRRSGCGTTSTPGTATARRRQRHRGRRLQRLLHDPGRRAPSSSAPSSPTATSGGRASTGPSSTCWPCCRRSGGHDHGRGQRPDRHLPRPRDPLHRPLRPGRLPPAPGRVGRGGHEVLRPRGLLVGHLPLRRSPWPTAPPARPGWTRSPRSWPRRHRHQRRPAGRHRPHPRRAGLQGGRRAVPHLDPRRLPGLPDAGRPASWRRSAKAAGFAALIRILLSAFPTVCGRLAAGGLGAGRPHPPGRGRAGHRADRRQADARLLVDQPRRLRPDRPAGGERHRAVAGVDVLPARLHLHGHRQLRHRRRRRRQGRQPPTTSRATGACPPGGRAGPGLHRPAAGPGRRAVHDRVRGQVLRHLGRRRARASTCSP